MNKPLVSVVMVVCNVERFLAEAIESILGQTFRDFEFIVVDFGSTDKSKEIVSAYAAKDNRIRLHEIPHCGLTQARNASWALAQGRYVANMDADDVSLPERLERQVEFMEKHNRVGVVCGGVELIDEAGTSLTNTIVASGVSLDRPTENRDLQIALLSGCPFWEAVLARRDAFVQVGGYRTVFPQAEDYDLWIRVAEHFELANLKQPVFKYRIHSHQVSVRKRMQQTLCRLAVQTSAAARRSGQKDPLDSVEEITPELLTRLGVNEAQQQFATAADTKGWIQFMRAAGEWSAAITAGIEMLKFSTRADDFEVARLYWKDNRSVMSVITVARTVIRRPRLTGRLLKLVLHRVGLVSSARQIP